MHVANSLSFLIYHTQTKKAVDRRGEMEDDLAVYLYNMKVRYDLSQCVAACYRVGTCRCFAWYIIGVHQTSNF